MDLNSGLQFLRVTNQLKRLAVYLSSITRLFQKADKIWHGSVTSRVNSNLLIISFLVGLVLATLSYFSILSTEFSYFISIEIAFSVLLILEVLGLIFILPKSVADSLGKQFEILSIILLRSAFKEFGAIKPPFQLESFLEPSNYYMFIDAFGALIIFLIIGFYYNVQRHEKITDTEKEQTDFIHFKQLLAAGILVVFVILGIRDLYVFALVGVYVPSINTFYLFLIFTDIIILLYSLRYASRYFNIFRYSSFAFATVLIRLALSSGPVVNVVIGVAAGLFVLGLSYAYNYFMKYRSIA